MRKSVKHPTSSAHRQANVRMRMFGKTTTKVRRIQSPERRVPQQQCDWFRGY